MSTNPSCPSCGGPLRWGGAQWMCDRCRTTYPPAQQQAYPPQQQAYPPQQHYPPQQQQPYPHPGQVAAPRSRKKLFIIIGAIVVLGGGLAVVLALTLGGGGSRGAGSPEAIAKGVIDALNARDGAAYSRLFAPQDMGEKVIDCKFEDADKDKVAEQKVEARKQWEKSRKIIEYAVGKTKAKFEFVAMEKRDDPVEKKVGDKLNEQCTTKVAHATQSFDVKVVRDGDATEKSLELVRIGDTWYLGGPLLIDDEDMLAAMKEIDKQEEEAKAGADDSAAEGGAGEDDSLRLFRAYVDEVCACKDSKCVSDTGTRFQEKAAKFKDQPKPPAEAVKPLAERMTRCTSEVMQKEMAGQGGDGTGLGFGGAGAGLGGGGGSDPMAELTQLTDAMCACTDRACAERVQEQLKQFSEKYKDLRATPEQEKQGAEIGQRLTGCMMKAMSN